MTAKAPHSPRTSLLVAALAVLAAGCAAASSAVDPGLAASIPRGASVVRLHSALPAGSLFSLVYAALDRRRAGRGVMFTEETGSRRAFRAGPIDAGRSTVLFADVVVEPEASGSVATFRGEWGVGLVGPGAPPSRAANGSTLGRAVWAGGRAGVAFGALVTVGREAEPDARLTYE